MRIVSAQKSYVNLTGCTFPRRNVANLLLLELGFMGSGIASVRAALRWFRYPHLLVGGPHQGQVSVGHMYLSLLLFSLSLRFGNILLIQVCLLFPSLVYAQACYSQLGMLRPGDRVCNSTTNSGACCNVPNGDVFTTSGLCLRQDASPGFLYQDSCADAKWGDSCPNYCSGKISRTRERRILTFRR